MPQLPTLLMKVLQTTSEEAVTPLLEAVKSPETLTWLQLEQCDGKFLRAGDDSCLGLAELGDTERTRRQTAIDAKVEEHKTLRHGIEGGRYPPARYITCPRPSRSHACRVRQSGMPCHPRRPRRTIAWHLHAASDGHAYANV